MVARLLALLALLMPLPAFAQAGDDGTTLAGSWALQIGPATIFRFDMKPVPGKPGEWTGTWARPQTFATDGDRFSRLVLPAKVTKSMAGLEFDGEVELSFDDPKPGAIPDIFHFKLIDADAAEMTYVGTDLKPYTVFRVKPGTPLGPYDPGAVYSRLARAAAPATLDLPPEIAAEGGAAQAPLPQPPPAALPDLPAIDAQGYRLPPKSVPTR